MVHGSCGILRWAPCAMMMSTTPHVHADPYLRGVEVRSRFLLNSQASLFARGAADFADQRHSRLGVVSV